MLIKNPAIIDSVKVLLLTNTAEKTNAIIIGIKPRLVKNIIFRI
jgi:hypothetical protein